MKKILVLIFIFVLFFSYLGFAAPVTIVDPSGQERLTVEKGAIRGPISKMVSSQTGSGIMYVGPCRVQKISMYSDSTGDIAGIYNVDTPVYGTPEFEIGISANTSSTWIDAGGAPFTIGIGILASDNANTVITIVYDY